MLILITTQVWPTYMVSVNVVGKYCSLPQLKPLRYRPESIQLSQCLGLTQDDAHPKMMGLTPTWWGSHKMMGSPQDDGLTSRWWGSPQDDGAHPKMMGSPQDDGAHPKIMGLTPSLEYTLPLFLHVKDVGLLWKRRTTQVSRFLFQRFEVQQAGR